MADPILYRKRLIPDECVLLKDDVILYRDDQMIESSFGNDLINLGKPEGVNNTLAHPQAPQRSASRLFLLLPVGRV